MPDTAKLGLAGGLTLRAVAAVCLTALLSQPLLAQTGQSYCATFTLPDSYETKAFYAPMAFRVASTPEGRVVIAEGEVKAGESQRLEQFLNQAGAIDEIWFNSPGGAAMEGPYMGRVIRKRGLAVRLKRDYACISACSYAFLGGVIRIVEPGAYYGVHMFSGTGDPAEMLDMLDRFVVVNGKRAELIRKGNPKEDVDEAVASFISDELRTWEQESAQLAATRARYLVEMSLSLDFMTDAFGTKSRQVCYLSQAGLRRYNVANTE